MSASVTLLLDTVLICVAMHKSTLAGELECVAAAIVCFMHDRRLLTNGHDFPHPCSYRYVSETEEKSMTGTCSSNLGVSMGRWSNGEDTDCWIAAEPDSVPKDEGAADATGYTCPNPECAKITSSPQEEYVHCLHTRWARACARAPSYVATPRICGNDCPYIL